MAPVWTPNGARLVYARQSETGAYHLFGRAASGTGAEEQVAGDAGRTVPTAVTPDGAFVLGYQIREATRRDVVRSTLLSASGRAGSDSIEVILDTPADERNGTVSPDGRFLAYEADESGRYEIYVRPYPNLGSGRWQVSVRGGSRPAWTNGGRELVFLNEANQMTAVSVEAGGPTFQTGTPVTLFTTVYAMPDVYRTYDVSGDGERFLMIKGEPSPAQGLVVVQNWFEELKRLVPRP